MGITVGIYGWYLEELSGLFLCFFIFTALVNKMKLDDICNHFVRSAEIAMKDAATKSYMKKGKDVVERNHNAIDLGANAFVKIDVPASWADAADTPDPEPRGGRPAVVKMVREILTPVDKMDGDSLPVSMPSVHRKKASVSVSKPLRPAVRMNDIAANGYTTFYYGFAKLYMCDCLTDFFTHFVSGGL